MSIDVNLFDSIFQRLSSLLDTKTIKIFFFFGFNNKFHNMGFKLVYCYAIKLYISMYLIRKMRTTKKKLF